MITLFDAERIVKEARGIVYDSYEEFADLFLFFDNQELLTYGGYNAPVVIEKNSGALWGLNAFAVKFPKLLDEKYFIQAGVVA